MKKTLIALAVLTVSSAAFAQSTVTLSGTLEIAPIRSTKLTTGAGVPEVSTAVKAGNLGQHNTWSTSVLNFTGVEDLGGGLKATAVMISGVGDGFAARERTLALSGNFGTVRFGRFVPAASAGFHAFSGSGSATLVGSIYGITTNSVGNETTATHNPLHNGIAMFERQDNVLQYTTPTINGFTANFAIVNNTTDSDAAALTDKIEGKQTSVHLGYSAGPLSAGFGYNTRTDATEGTAAAAAGAPNLTGIGALGAAAVAATTGTTVDTDLKWIGASYDLGVATLYATSVEREAKGGNRGAVAVTTTDASVSNFGVSVPMGAVTLRASTYTGKDKRTIAVNDDMKLSGHQVSAVYALSKRTAIVAATGTNQFKRDGANSVANTRKISGTTLGVNHTF